MIMEGSEGLCQYVYVWCICVFLCVYVHVVMMCLIVMTLLHLASQSKRAAWMPDGASHGI